MFKNEFDFFKIGDSKIESSYFYEGNESVDELYRLDEEIISRPGTEGLFDSLKNILLPDIRYNESTGMIEIRNLNFSQLNNRVKNLYSKERNVFTIFNIIYNSYDWKKYKDNRISKSKMRKLYIEIEPFFALEVMIMFEDLYKQYGLAYYDKIAKWLYNNTWVSKRNITRTTIDARLIESEIDKKYKLKDYQAEFILKYPELKDSNNLNGYLLSFDQGLGKSLTSIALSVALKKDLVVIVCPNSLKGNWSNEIYSYFTKYRKDKKLFESEVYAVGYSKHPYQKDKVKYLIINFESINKIYSMLPTGRKNTMIITDESHYFRNADSKRSLELIKLKDMLKSKDNLMMSGTPIKALPSEMVPVMRMIDPLFTESVAIKYSKVFNVEGLATAEIVKRRFSRIMHRRTKDEVLNLPPIHINNLPVMIKNGGDYTIKEVTTLVMQAFDKYMGMEGPKHKKYRSDYLNMLSEIVNKYQSKIDMNYYREYLEFLRYFDSGKPLEDKYNELAQEKMYSFTKIQVFPLITDKKVRDTFKMNETRYIRLRASCMGRAIGEVLPKYRTSMFISMYNENKKKIVDMITKNTKKTVIFSALLGVAKHIANDLSNSGIGTVLIVGETKDRMDIINKFKYSDEIQVIVASTQTLATGVTLTEANQMFFFGVPWRKADYEQAIARIHRIGQTMESNVYNILLDTGKDPNLSTRMNSILDWSGNMFEGFIEIDRDALDGNKN